MTPPPALEMAATRVRSDPGHGAAHYGRSQPRTSRPPPQTVELGVDALSFGVWLTGGTLSAGSKLLRRC
jgi:hypothetical protein